MPHHTAFLLPVWTDNLFRTRCHSKVFCSLLSGPTLLFKRKMRPYGSLTTYSYYNSGSSHSDFHCHMHIHVIMLCKSWDFTSSFRDTPIEHWLQMRVIHSVILVYTDPRAVLVFPLNHFKVKYSAIWCLKTALHQPLVHMWMKINAVGYLYIIFPLNLLFFT